MFGKFFRILLILIVSFAAESCYKEYDIVPDYSDNVFNFVMSPNAESKILESRAERYEVEPKPVMYYGSLLYNLVHLKVRGQSALNFQRKSLSVKVANSFITPNDQIETQRFKLNSMVYDYTYIENMLAYSIFRNLNMYPLSFFYTEVKLNNKSQGLYLFIEDPAEYCFNNFGAEIMIRRYYRGEISEFELNPRNESLASDLYLLAFDSIYQTLKLYSGKVLYDQLSARFNITKYMRKMAVDFMLKNGDSTDEIFFWGKKLTNGQIYFDIIPWDYDDTFEPQPHEIGRDWAVGAAFGKRAYSNSNDVLAVTGNRMIFSVEDDIDYAFATDDYLYQKYLQELKSVLSDISIAKTEQLLKKISSELKPFYRDSAVPGSLLFM